MPQYLTSSKVCLLVLVAVYCEGLVPTDATIPVLSLITSQQLPIRAVSGRSASSARPRGIVELDEIRNVLAKFSSTTTSRNLWEGYHNVLSQISNLDALFNFFSSLKQVLGATAPHEQSTPLVLSKTSLVGSFVRRSQLEFEKLSFQDVVELWQSFRRFTSAFLKRPSSPEDELESADVACGGRIAQVLGQPGESYCLNNHSLDDSSQVSSQDAERLLEAQHQQMREIEHRLLRDMQTDLTDLPRSSLQAASSSYYVQFLDASLSGDYSTSFEYLHRYYDYDMRLRSGHTFYQFALLSTALLQADLGCYDEAINTLHETVAIARENKDTWCLIFTLHWLYHIQTIIGKGSNSGIDRGIMDSDSKSLAFLKAKAMESKVWPIASATLLREAQLALTQGHPPHEALEHVYEAFSMNVHHRMWREIKSQHLQQSAVLARLDVSPLASSYCALVMDFATRRVEEKETLQAQCRSAYAAVLNGNLKLAQKLIADVKLDARHSLPMKQFVHIVNGLIKLKACLYSNDLQYAELLLGSLSQSPIADPELRFQLSLLLIDYRSRMGDFDGAYALIEQLSPSALKSSSEGILRSQSVATHDVFKGIHLLLSKAKLFVKFKMPQKGFSLALRATIAALEACILPVLWEAIALLASIMVAIGEAIEARNLLWSVTWPATESGNLELMATIYCAHADAAINIARKSMQIASDRAPALRQTLTWVQRAYDCYDKLGDVLHMRDMVARMSATYSLLGETIVAKEKAEAFAKLHAEMNRRR